MQNRLLHRSRLIPQVNFQTDQHHLAQSTTTEEETTYPNVLAEVLDSFSLDAGGVPVLDDVPDSSPPRILVLGPNILRPLLLREVKVEDGANETGV